MIKRRSVRIISLLAAAVLILAALSACGSGSSGNTKPGGSSGNAKDPYGFTSAFEDETDESIKLKNFPEIKEMLLALEKALKDKGFEISRIYFNGRGFFAKFFIGSKVDDIFKADDTLVVQYDRANDGTFYIYEMEGTVYNTDKYEAVRDAMISVMDFDELEIKAFKELKEDTDVQTAEYYVGYYEGRYTMHPDMDNIKTESFEEYEKIASQTKDFPYKKFSYNYHVAENEKQTVLYQAKREARKPKAEGRNIDAGGLSFNIPEAMKVNPYSGMLSVWEYYTGEYDGSGYANGIDLGLMTTSLKGKDFMTYLTTESRPANSKGVTPFEPKEIRGITWYTCNNGRTYYYATEHDGRAYEIEIRYTQVVDGVTFEGVVDLLERTLFFE